MSISVKSEPELRHVLAHIYYAVEAAAESVIKNDVNKAMEALFELKSVEGLVFWDEDTDDMSRSVNRWHKESSNAVQKLQGQEEELQGKA